MLVSKNQTIFKKFPEVGSGFDCYFQTSSPSYPVACGLDQLF